MRYIEGLAHGLAVFRSISRIHKPAYKSGLVKRLHKYWDELLTFLKKPHIPPTNNHAEREVRPAVIMRKVMQGNQTDQGARTQAVLMSIYRTLKRRGLNPAYEITQALSRFILSKQLPTMPKTPSDG